MSNRWPRLLRGVVRPPRDGERFAAGRDEALCRLNADYAPHRVGDLTMRAPEVCDVPRGGFAAWLGSQGKAGGQHKLPRMDNSGRLTAELSRAVLKR